MADPWVRRDQQIAVEVGIPPQRLRGVVRSVLADSIVIELRPTPGPEQLPLLTNGRGIKLEVAFADGLRVLHTTSLGPAGSAQLLSVAQPNKVDRIQRRRHVRLPTSVPYSYSAGSGPAMQGSGSTTDLSSSGLRILTAKPLPEGTTLNLVINLPGEPPLRVIGQVVRSRQGAPGEMGVQFQKLGTAGETVLWRFLCKEELRGRGAGRK